MTLKDDARIAFVSKRNATSIQWISKCLQDQGQPLLRRATLDQAVQTRQPHRPRLFRQVPLAIALTSTIGILPLPPTPLKVIRSRRSYREQEKVSYGVPAPFPRHLTKQFILAPLSAASYTFPPGAADPRYAWHEPEYAPSSAVADSPQVEGPASNYWRLNEPPIAPNHHYQKRPDVSTEQTSMQTAVHSPWGPPPANRSMSFPAIESLSIPGHVTPYPVQSPQDIRRTSNISYTSVDHGSTNSSISIPGSNPGSMGPPGPVHTPTHATPTHQQFPYKPQQWSPYPPQVRQSSLPSHSEAYGGQWYNEPAPLGHVAEEPPHSAPPFNLGPQSYFTGTNQSHGP